MKTVIAFVTILGIAMAIGWGMNLIALANSDFEQPYKSEVIRVVGVFVPPVGGVVGYMTLEE